MGKSVGEIWAKLPLGPCLSSTKLKPQMGEARAETLRNFQVQCQGQNCGQRSLSTVAVGCLFLLDIYDRWLCLQIQGQIEYDHTLWGMGPLLGSSPATWK